MHRDIRARAGKSKETTTRGGDGAKPSKNYERRVRLPITGPCAEDTWPAIPSRQVAATRTAACSCCG
ncbi:unnamed protein product [Lampetra fluviatilis]